MKKRKTYKISLKYATQRMIKLSLTTMVFLLSFIAIITTKYYKYNEINLKGETIWNTLSYSNLFVATEKYEVISKAKASTYNLFKNEDKNELKDDVTLEKIEESKKLVDSLEDYNLKKELLNNIDIANELFINKSFHKLNINYISQNRNNVYNGCEAASMLMALNFKGYLLNTSLYEFSYDMPKSDNPYDGFYLDIFKYEPLTEAHWIAPQPLVKYSIEKSGYSNIMNSTGYELYELRNEILNDNPVIIYVTSFFTEPYNYSNDVPVNLHVVLIAGYNPITDEYYIIDPYTASDGKYEYIINEEKLNYLYTKIGKKSVIIK